VDLKIHRSPTRAPSVQITERAKASREDVEIEMCLSNGLVFGVTDNRQHRISPDKAAA
jgi:hypothetical protein